MLNNQKNRIYIGDLPLSVTEGFIKNTLLEGYKGITKIELFKKKYETFCFVTFSSDNNIKKIITELNYTKIDGKPCRIVPADEETLDIIRRRVGNVIICGLDESIEVSQLHEAFSNFGDIICSKIPMIYRKGEWVSRGYGYVQFRNPDDAKRAIRELIGASINDKPLHLCESLHKSKEFLDFQKRNN